MRLLAVILFFCSSVASADVYCLGSSFLGDANCDELDWSPQRSIYAAKPLSYILANPDGHSGDGKNVPWDVALVNTTFSHIAFQYVMDGNSTQASDVVAIETFIEMPNQTNAMIVLQPHWPWPDQAQQPNGVWEERYHEDANNTVTNTSLSYANQLLATLRANNPSRSFVNTRINEMLDHIFHDVENGVGPISEFGTPPYPVEGYGDGDMFRDGSGHLSRDYGRYMAHNAMRQAMGQTTGVDATTIGVDPIVRDYLDAVIALYPAVPGEAVPSMGRGALVGLGIALLILGRMTVRHR